MPDEKEARIGELEQELANKEQELFGALDKIEKLEDTVMRLDAITSDGDSKKGKKGKDSKLAINLDEREREIRELKNKMGYLRKEKVQLQQELDKIAKKQGQSSVIRIEEKKTPIDALVNELQSKINKQRLLMTKLKQKSMSAESSEMNQILSDKEQEIDSLKSKLLELEEKLESMGTKAEAGEKATITRALTEELQNKLNKSKRQIDSLKSKLSKVGKKKGKAAVDDSAIDELHEKIDELKEDLTKKKQEIDTLKNNISTLKEAKASGATAAEAGAPSGSAMGDLTEELQNKLNKAKITIKSLQAKIVQARKGKAPATGESQEQLENELKMQKEMVISLQQESANVKKEAIQNKIKCEDLEAQVNLKEQKINELNSQLESLQSQAQAQPAQTQDPNVALRLRELKNMLDDLNKQNIQQRLEITQLRQS